MDAGSWPGMTKTHVDDDDDDDDAILRLGINPPIISNALISGANMDHDFWPHSRLSLGAASTPVERIVFEMASGNELAFSC